MKRVFKEDFSAKGIFDHVCKIFGGKKILLQGTVSIIVLRKKHYIDVIFVF